MIRDLEFGLRLGIEVFDMRLGISDLDLGFGIESGDRDWELL